MEKFRNDALENKRFDTPDPEFVDEKILEIVKNGMCMLRNGRNLVPLTKEKARILIIDVTDEDNKSSNLLKEELEARGYTADVKRDIYDVPSRVCWQADVDKLQAEYDYCIFNVNAFFVAQWSVPHMLIWASHLFDKNKKIIVNYGSPYFAEDYFPEDDTFIEMNCSPNTETVKLLADALVGKIELTGRSILKERR